MLTVGNNILSNNCLKEHSTNDIFMKNWTKIINENDNFRIKHYLKTLKTKSKKLYNYRQTIQYFSHVSPFTHPHIYTRYRTFYQFLFSITLQCHLHNFVFLSIYIIFCI